MAQSLRERVDYLDQTSQELHRDQYQMQYGVNPMVRHMHLHDNDYLARESDEETLSRTRGY